MTAKFGYGCLALAAFACLTAIGLWQLDRAHQKAAIQAAYDVQRTLPPADLAQVDLADPEARFRAVTATGRFDDRHQVLLDNQVRNGRPGYHVYTPLRTGDGPAVLVNRGWVPAGPTRERLPAIAAPEGEVRVSGRVGQPANPGLRLGKTAGDGWPRVVQFLDYAELAAALPYELAPAVVHMDARDAGAYAEDWRPDPGGFGPERHRGYAVQWFAMAVTVAVIYLVLNFRAGRARAR